MEDFSMRGDDMCKCMGLKQEKLLTLPSVVATVVYGVGVNGIAVDWVAVAAKAAKGLAGLAGLSGLLSLSALSGKGEAHK